MHMLIATTQPTTPSEYDKEIDGADQTPGIDYVHGEELDGFKDEWYESLEAMTRAEPHLLSKTREDLEPAVNERRIVVAIDRTRGDMVVGCIILWPLCQDEHESSSAGPSLSTDRLIPGDAERRPLHNQPSSARWYELGTFLVIPEYRYGRSHLPIGDILYRYLLATNREKNILGTTTNSKAIHTGMRHGMQMIRFTQLPRGVHTATCICPVQKTGAINNALCRLKDQECRVRISTETWRRLGQPDLLPFP